MPNNYGSQKLSVTVLKVDKGLLKPLNRCVGVGDGCHEVITIGAVACALLARIIPLTLKLAIFYKAFQSRHPKNIHDTHYTV